MIIILLWVEKYSIRCIGPNKAGLDQFLFYLSAPLMRILEVIIPLGSESDFEEITNHDCVIECWTAPVDYDRVAIKILTDDEHAKELLEELDGLHNKHRVIIYPIQGTVPKVETAPSKNGTTKLGKFLS